MPFLSRADTGKLTMSRPTLQDVLREHRERERQRAEQQESKHVVLSSRNAKALFLDLPRGHRFWLVTGGEINNLTELYRSLISMSPEVFSHHVNDSRDDFAAWVGEVLGDTVLARRLRASHTKHEHVEIVKHRIDELKATGIKIAVPRGNLQPDFGFIRIERPPASASQDTGQFRIRGHPLEPDARFLNIKRPEKENPGTEELMALHNEIISTIRSDIKEKALLKSDLEALRDDYLDLSAQLSAVRNELSSVKNEIHRYRVQQKVHEKTSEKTLQRTVSQLREQEKSMLVEIEEVAKTEERVLKRSDLLVNREKELLDKEKYLAAKEQRYLTLLEEYNHRIAGMEKKGAARHSRIADQKAAGHKEHPDSAQGAESQDREEQVVMQKKEEPLFPQEKTKPGLREMLDKTHSSKKTSEPGIQNEITGLLDETKKLASAKNNLAMQNIARLKEMLECPSLDSEFKKDAYYQVLELETDLELAK